MRQFATSVGKTAWISDSVSKENWPTQPLVHSGGFSVMFWSCVSYFGFGPLVPLTTTLNASRYCELLETVIAPYIREIERIHGVRLVLMQDNAPCHKARIVMAKLAELGITTFPWPPYSPDSNVIENAWAIWKHRRYSSFGYPRTKQEMTNQALETWARFTQAEARKLVRSFPKRMRMLIKTRGKAIRY
jgi:transposase